MSNNPLCEYPGICDFWDILNKIKDEKKKDKLMYKYNIHLCDKDKINEITKSGKCIERYKNIMETMRKDEESKIEHNKSYVGGKRNKNSKKTSKKKRSKCGGNGTPTRIPLKSKIHGETKRHMRQYDRKMDQRNRRKTKRANTIKKKRLQTRLRQLSSEKKKILQRRSKLSQKIKEIKAKM